MAKNLRRLHTTLLRSFLLRGKVKALPVIPSKQLQVALFTQELTDSKGIIRVPHYWAVIVHDGRKQSLAKPGGLLVWFRNPKNDPRYRGAKYPTTRSQRRRMTKEEFRKWSRVNQQIINRYKKAKKLKTLTSSDYRAMNLPMIIAKRSPSPGRSDPFFSNAPGGGMYNFAKEMNIVGKRIVTIFVTRELQKKGLLRKTIKKTINF